MAWPFLTWRATEFLLIPACPDEVKALLMEEALLRAWLPSIPATDPDTETEAGPRQV